MSRALRNRRNRRDTSVRGDCGLCGAVVSAVAYSTGNAMVTVHPAIPLDAEAAAQMDWLLPGGE